MSDPAGELLVAVEAVLRADAGVAAAFPRGRVRLYDLPPQNAPLPYITLADAHATDFIAEGLDGAETVLAVHVWSRTDPPGTAEAKAIAAAVKAALTNLPELDMPGHRLADDALPLDTLYLQDADGQTVHAVVRVQFSTDPL